MGIKVKLGGFGEGIAAIRKARESYKPVVARELKAWSDEEVSWLKVTVLTNALGLKPKKRFDGKPPLVDTETYIRSYSSFLEAFDTVGIVSVGMNTNMSNADLAELLEYGWNGGPARPHLRPLAVHMQSRVPVLGERIANGIFGSA